MAIFIDKRRATEEEPIEFIREQDKLAKQIVRAWQQSKKVKHHFKKERYFKRAIRRNLKTLDFPDAIDTFFTRNNYLFCTKAKGRQPTLYFKNCATNRTGRLRQQHQEGPLAKIDKKPKKHLFLSRERFYRLKRWHDKHKHDVPDFEAAEERVTPGNRHIEFAQRGDRVSGWHESKGKVKTSEANLDRRINSALRNILGHSN
jgi:hypothetical protein